MHNARGDLTGVVRERGASDFYAYDPCQNRVYHAATEHGAALASALDKASRERATMGDIPVDLVAARFPHHAASFGYEPGDRVVVVARADSRTELTYDANGQVVSKTIIRGPERTTWGYAWNARGELVRLTTPNGKVWTYRYDGAGRRVEKKSPTGDTWRYVWMGAVLLHTLRNDALAETYIHEPGGTCPILRATADGDVRFILPDQNDAPSEEIGPEGKLEWAARKGTWGEGFNAGGASGGEPALGQWYDAESGLHYNFFRYYDPDVARFLSPDPIDLLGGLNAYLAVSDPFTQYDRFGLSKEGSDCGSSAPAKSKPGLPPNDEDADGRAKSGAEVTDAKIRAAMAGAPLTTQQGAVSVPAVKAYVDRLAAGDVAPPIKVDNGIIVEGNHRYIAGRLFGTEPAVAPGTLPSFKQSAPTVSWQDVKLDPTDWGNR